MRHLIGKGWNVTRQTTYYFICKHPLLDYKIEVTPFEIGAYEREDDEFGLGWRQLFECRIKIKLTDESAAALLSLVVPSDAEMAQIQSLVKQAV